MGTEDLVFRRAVVLGSALVYWAGVLIQARRIRRHIGRSPNVTPRGTKERLLWVGWFFVIVVWLAIPFVASQTSPLPWLRPLPSLLHPALLGSGLLLIVAGYVGTLACYTAMGDTWRIGINREEKNALVTRGPYRFVRHPIYLFQVVILAGVCFLLPALLSFTILGIHLLCVLIKAADEESYLVGIHGEEYGKYLSRTGRLFPKLTRSGSQSD